MSLYCVYRKYASGQSKYHASVHDDRTRKTLADGGFPTVEAVKKWARQWAKAKKTTVAFEKV